ncbi:TPA: autotransporter outer membrane beta-barrel domain-containing protein [Escherichia coli]
MLMSVGLNAEVRDNIRFGLEFEKSAFGKNNVDNAVNANFRIHSDRILLKRGLMAPFFHFLAGQFQRFTVSSGVLFQARVIGCAYKRSWSDNG